MWYFVVLVIGINIGIVICRIETWRIGKGCKNER